MLTLYIELLRNCLKTCLVLCFVLQVCGFHTSTASLQVRHLLFMKQKRLKQIGKSVREETEVQRELRNSNFRVLCLGQRSRFSDQLRDGRSGDRIPVGDEIFLTCPDRPWAPPSLLYDRYRVFPRSKERPGRDADPSPPSSAVGNERVELYLYFPYGPYSLYRALVPVQG